MARRLTRRARDRAQRPCKVFVFDAGDANALWLVGGKHGRFLLIRTHDGKRLGGIYDKRRLRTLAESILWMLDGKDYVP
jgi:hypothetical protein